MQDVKLLTLIKIIVKFVIPENGYQVVFAEILFKIVKFITMSLLEQELFTVLLVILDSLKLLLQILLLVLKELTLIVVYFLMPLILV